MLEELLRGPVATAEMFGDPLEVPALFPEEEQLLTDAVAERRREFSTARKCAKNALGRLGIAPGPILRTPEGAPLWPDGIVGSITHCVGYRAAAVAKAADLLALGVDAEPHLPLGDRSVLEMVTLAEERDHLRELATSRRDVHWDRLMFSAKECVFKTWFPLTRDWLDFDEAAITLHPRTGTFTARLLVPGPQVDGVRLTGFEGGFLVRDGLLLTAIAVRRAAGGSVR